MNKALIVLLSSTSAMSIKTMLSKRYKIKTELIQAPSKIASLGCAYCLEIDYADLKTAINLIKASGITVKGAYYADTLERIY